MSITARHFANRAPSSRYSTSRARRPSSPSVTSSSGDFASGVAPLSTLMPGMMPGVFEHAHERAAVGGLLADRLVEEDHAADEVGRARGREQHLAVRAPAVLGRLAPDRVEALLDRAAALVGREDALARRDERPRGLVERCHRCPFVAAYLRTYSGYSHSIVPGGFDVMSYATRFTPGTSLMIR